MNRILTFLTILLLMSFAESFAYSGGAGTVGNPYQISTTDDLIELSKTSADWASHFILTQDIAFDANEQLVDWDDDGTATWDAGDQLGFSPIGNNTTNFTGTFNGQGFEIVNLFINRPSQNDVGLFGKTNSDFEVSNLGVTNVDVTGDEFVAGIVGSNDGTVYSCFSSGIVYGNENAGLIVGFNNTGTISFCNSTGDVSGALSIGGLLGGNFSGIVSNCNSSGTVYGDNNVGGLVGFNYYTSVTQSYSSCDVTTSNYTAGGLVGINYSLVSNCYATGDVDGIENIGGLVGSNSGDVNNCYSTGLVSGTTDVGGLIGENFATVTNSFWDTQTSLQATSAGGTGRTTAQMKTQSTFTSAGWDFLNIWRINSTINTGYPYLRIFHRIYVDLEATGFNDGSSWANAFTSFQSALDAASIGDEIWVAAGTYKPSSPYDLTYSPRYYHFRMVNGVEIYGGFAGNEDPNTFDLDDRDFEANETILSGDIGTIGDHTDNCYHLFFHPSGLGLTSSAILDGFTITRGYANGSSPHNRGGGIYNYNNTPQFVNITFLNNFAGNAGGGIFNEQVSSMNIIESQFIGNSTNNDGGGIKNVSSNTTMTNVIFSNNTAVWGGAIYCYDGNHTYTNGLVTNNSGQNGGAIYADNSQFVLRNFTISKNNANNGGGIYFLFATATFNNSIIWGNSAANLGNQINLQTFSSTTLNYSCYENGSNDIVVSSSTFTATNNNITSNPKFANQENGDFRIAGNSPAIDAGNNAYNSLSTDIRGEARIQNVTIDMGAYEYNSDIDPDGSFIFVKHDAAGDNDGSTWDDAFTSFQSGLDAASANDIIWVAAGTYKPSYDYGLGGGSRYNHFRMIEGVEIYGGFAGDEDPNTFVLAERDFEANETILSGDIGTVGNMTDNCYHLFYHPSGIGLTSSAILDGFTITDGNANGSAPHNRGGGMYNNNNSPNIQNCIFIYNIAEFGGALWNEICPSNFTNCQFINNSSYRGGAIYSTASNSTFKDCIFDNNNAIVDFGGVAFNDVNSPQYINCLFTNNNAVSGGAITNHNNSNAAFINCTFASNSATNGGAIYNLVNSSPTFNNSIIYNNSATNSGNQFFISGGTTTLNFSCYSNSANDVHISGGTFTATNNNITLNPLFVDSDNGDYRLSGVSPAVDAGNDSYSSEEYDIRGPGFPRKLDKNDHTQVGTIDMGAYEYKEGTDPLGCFSAVYVSDDYDSNTPGWQVTHFDELSDALAISCAGATVHISDYTHTGNVDMTGYTFIIGDGDFDLDGTLSGGLIQTPSTGRLILPAMQNVQRNYPLGNGSNNFTLKIIPGNEPTNPIFVRLVEKSVPGAVKAPMPFWEIEGDDDLDATIVFRIDKSAIAPKTLNTNSILRFFDGDKYVPVTEEQVTINDMGAYYEVIIINVNKF